MCVCLNTGVHVSVGVGMVYACVYVVVCLCAYVGMCVYAHVFCVERHNSCCTLSAHLPLQ